MHLLVESQGDAAGRAAALGPHLAIISRPGLFARLEPRLRPLGVPIVYWAHDLHFVRLGLQARFHSRLAAGAPQAMRLVEAQCFTRADLAVLPTSDETVRARVEFPGARVVATPYFAMPDQPLPAGPPVGERIVFVGGEHHGPNRDGVEWFLDAVWPGIRDRSPQAELVVVGRWHRARPWPSGVHYSGVIAEAELDALLRSARVGIAPLRFGAGMKRKTLHYLSHGLPVVGTGFAVEGLETDESGSVAGVLLAETVREWESAIGSLADPDLWMRLSRSGHHYVQEAFSMQAFRHGLASVLSEANRVSD